MKSTKYYLAGLALSFVVFCLIAFVPEKIIIFLFLGVSPFLSSLLPKEIRLDFTKPAQAFFCGVIVTCFQLTAGVSGPLLDVFFQNIAMTRHQVVATKAFTQSISHVTKFVYFGLIVPGAFSLASGPPLWLYLAVIPAAVTGSNLAKHVLNKITDKQFYKATQWMLWAIGIVYLIKAFLLMQGGP